MRCAALVAACAAPAALAMLATAATTVRAPVGLVSVGLRLSAACVLFLAVGTASAAAPALSTPTVSGGLLRLVRSFFHLFLFCCCSPLSSQDTPRVSGMFALLPEVLACVWLCWPSSGSSLGLNYLSI